jgi:hypothetical protein
MRGRSLTAIAAVLVACTCAAPASAGELQADVGLGMRKSTWRGDYSVGSQLGFGYRFARVFAIDVVTWEERASVDDRLNTGLTIGVSGTFPLRTVRPTLRAYFIHQHEEGWVSVVDHPFGTLAGIGAGIRHRAGFGTRLGLEIPFAKKNHLEWFVLTGLDATWFPDATLGPAAYYGVMGGIGLNYDLTELP